MIGTGAFKLKSYTEKKGAELVRHNAYWGGRPALDGVKLTFFTGSAPLVLALRGGQIDLRMQLSPQEAQVFKNNSKYIYYSQPVSAHRQTCMRTDLPVFKDARVRRALALTINRPQQLARVMLGNGLIGDDNPFWKKFASTDPSIKQRRQNLQLAKALLAAAGAENLKFTLTTWNFLDHPDHAASIQAYAREAGITVGIEVMDGGRYYDSEPPGADYATTTPWLWRPATLTEYGWRGVPNLYVTRCYMSTGDWNASHYKNPEFDSVARSFLAAVDVQTAAQGNEEDGRSAPSRHPGRHRLLHQLRDCEHHEGEGIRARGDLADGDGAAEDEPRLNGTTRGRWSLSTARLVDGRQ